MGVALSCAFSQHITAVLRSFSTLSASLQALYSREGGMPAQVSGQFLDAPRPPNLGRGLVLYGQLFAWL